MRIKPEVVTLGLGYIGLPTSALIAKMQIPVLGVDVQSSIVKTINEGKIHIAEPDLDEIVNEAVKNGLLAASMSPEEANTYLVVVPTPFNSKHEPDISFVESATQSVIPLLKAGDLFIIESTCPVGTTEHIAKIIFQARPELSAKISVAYCPERVLPGNVMNELINNDRVVGGIDENSTREAKKFYERFVKGEIHETNARTAEMCKLVENSSRDVQIAFANELSIICDKAKIDVWNLISLANKHPRVNILSPGSGVGGHCIAVDPYFIVANYPMESQIIGKAREINNYKSFWVSEKIQEARLQFEVDNGRKPSVALMGLAFKPDIDDLRESPAKYIVQKVLQDDQDGEFFIVEPNISDHRVFKLTATRDAIEKADIICFLVAHNEFKKISINNNKKILDFCGVRTHETL